MNIAILSGNLVADPELRQTNSGKSVCNFRIATQEYKDETEYHNIVTWDKVADVAGKYLVKGARVNITGRIKTEQWTDRDDNKRYTTKIIVGPGGLELVGKRQKDDEEKSEPAPAGDDIGI